ncbi:MAG TPA: response regulator transcription factor [Candidatus Acidoferrum sp.]|nr:response regulator transcription factor [Candidatus Acidoferrum sp.]
MNAAAKSFRVMLVDDHAVTRAGFRFLFDTLPEVEVVAEAANGEEALMLYHLHQPDLVILDMSMPGMSGREVLAQLRQQWPTSKVLVCTMHENTALVDHVLNHGAAGYISKNSSPEELVNALRRIAGGHKYVDGSVVPNLVGRDSRQAVMGLDSLSPRELEILCLYAEARTIDEIAVTLVLSSKTVANNLTTIKEKLQVNSTAELVRLAINNGLVSL